MAKGNEPLKKVLREVLAPLIEADGGVLYLVAADKKQVSVHLGGSYSGCPGTTLTAEQVLEPAIRTVLPKVKVVVSSGFRVPKGAERIPAEG
jgi:Fe-S cluster biogenesis protein NfuA